MVMVVVGLEVLMAVIMLLLVMVAVWGWISSHCFIVTIRVSVCAIICERGVGILGDEDAYDVCALGMGVISREYW